MKKILCFILCFVLMSSSVCASGAIGNAASNVIASTEDAAWQVLNKLCGASRTVVAVADRGLEFLKSFFQPRFERDGTNVQYLINNYVTYENHNYIIDPYLYNYINEYADYCFRGVENEPVTYKCIDIYGKNFKYSDTNGFVDVAWLYEVCKRYQDNYYISLCFQGSVVYETSQYFSVVRNSSLYDDTVPLVLLEPKTYGYLVPNSYYTLNNNLYGLYSQSGNGGGQSGAYPFEQFTVDKDLNLLNHGGASSPEIRSLFQIRIRKAGDYYTQFMDPFLNSPFNSKLPIVYQKDEYIELYNDGFPAANPNATVRHKYVNIPNVKYTNTVPDSIVDSIPTTQDMQNYEDFRDAINGDNNSVTNEEIINYITNIYPNGDDYTTDPNPPDKGGGLISSLVDALGGLGTLIGSIISGLLSAIVNALTVVVRSFQDIVALISNLIPDNFRSFMEIFYGLVPEPIMNGIVALFSLMCIMAVIRLIRK